LRDVQEEIEQTILRRRSTRTFTGQAFIIDELATILDYAYRPYSSSPASLFVPSLVETYLVVQKVIGMEPGVYYFSPQKMQLKRLVAGDFRTQTWHFCLGQELAKDAAVIVVHVAHLKTAVAQYGDRAYRYLHLDAGQIGQRLNLAAIKMELGVSGIGGFYDNEINALLGLSLDRIVLYVTTLGRPKSEA
jgi:SagB-type dehydrogenase family enzyme